MIIVIPKPLIFESISPNEKEPNPGESIDLVI